MTLSPVLDIGELEPPVLFFGGPYSNLQATEAMLKRAESLNIPPDRIVCTGDVVAYGADPEATSRLIRDSGIHVVMGNCEESLASSSEDCGCGFEEGMACAAFSDNWYRFAQGQVSDRNRQWMGELPRVLRLTLGQQRCCVIHGGLHQINQFIFESTEDQVKSDMLDAADCDIMIGGHCGLPFGQRLQRGAWLNAGVIGLPANDATTDGWYLLIKSDDAGLRATWYRLDYDFQTSHRSMLEHGLNDYADSMLSGLWPSMDILPDAERLLRGRGLAPRDLLL